MRLPFKISPVDIINTSYEIRFSSFLPREAVFGILFQALQSEYGNLQKLPVLQIPEHIRDEDPNLKFKPYYSLTSKNYIVQIGPDIISIGKTKDEYIGWPVFSKVIYDCIQRVLNTKIIDNVSRLGLRYISFFPHNIFNNINLSIALDQDPLIDSPIIFRTELLDDDFLKVLQIANNTSHNNINGSVIDIDIVSDVSQRNFFKDYVDLSERAHIKEKYLFFSLLKEDFLKTLNPQYT